MSHSGAAVVPYVDTASREDMGYTYLWIHMISMYTCIYIIFSCAYSKLDEKDNYTSQAVVHDIHNTHIYLQHRKPNT